MKWLIPMTDILVLIWSSLAILRFFLQKGGLPYRHSLAICLYHITQWIVGATRKFVPPAQGWDIAIIVAVVLLILVYEFLKLSIFLLQLDINLSIYSLFMGTFLIAVLKIISAFIYAMWYELIIWYLLQNNVKDMQLFQAVNFSLNQLLSILNRQYKPKLVVFIGCMLWILVLYPRILHWLQNYLIS